MQFNCIRQTAHVIGLGCKGNLFLLEYMDMDNVITMEDPLMEAPQRSKTEGLTRIGCFCGGIMDDYRRRIPHISSDIRMGYTRKTLSSALFMFFATFASTVALGVVIRRNTVCDDEMEGKGFCVIDGDQSAYLGVTEYLLMNSVAGMFHAAFGCQPLLVLRPTGPITAFCTLLFNVAKSLHLDFSVFFGWTGASGERRIFVFSLLTRALLGVFVGFYMLLVAAFDVSRHIGLLTRFLHEIFAFFVCSIYIVFIDLELMFIDLH